MEYIIDDKGNKLKFVINKKYTVKKLDSVFLIYFLREKSIKDEISALANAEEKGTCITEVEVEKIIRDNIN